MGTDNDSAFRGSFGEAIEKLHRVQDLTQSSLGVRGKIILFFNIIFFILFLF